MRHDDPVLTRQLQWGRNLTVAEGVLALVVLARGLELQWGRNLTVAEGSTCGATSRCRPELQWGRNLTVAEGVSRRPSPSPHRRFNGAAT